MTYDFFDDNLPAFAADLISQAQQSKRTSAAKRLGPLRYIVADLEYRYDRLRYEEYLRREGDAASKKLRWPFHSLVASAVAIIDYTPGMALPKIHSMAVEVLEAPETVSLTERRIALSLFQLLEANPKAVLVGWGHEFKDLQVLRRIASQHGLVMPHQIADRYPYSPARIDINMTCSTLAARPHLPEFAMASDVPCKAIPSNSVGDAAEAERWNEVREQVIADMFTTSILLNRHLIAQGQVMVDAFAADAHIADQFVASFPHNNFLNINCRGWSAHRRAEADFSRSGNPDCNRNHAPQPPMHSASKPNIVPVPG